MFIPDNKADGVPNEEGIQPQAQVTEESKKVENNYSIILINIHWTFKNLTTWEEILRGTKPLAYILNF